MKFKMIALAALIALASSSSNIQAKTCRQEFQDRIDAIPSYYTGVNPGHVLGASVVGSSFAVPIVAGVLGITDLIIGNMTVGIIPVTSIAFGAGISVPVILTTAYIADTLADAPFVKMLKIIERANIEAGLVNDETLHTDFKQEIPVDGVTRCEIRSQREHNQEVRKHNRKLNRLNRAISDRINKRKKAFDDLIASLEKKREQKVDRLEVAKLVVEADVQERVCNGEIRLQDRDLTLRTDYRDDYIRVIGATTLEKMKQRRHNRKVEDHNAEVDLHNYKIAKLIEKKDLAKLKHLVDYLDAQLP